MFFFTFEVKRQCFFFSILGQSLNIVALSVIEVYLFTVYVAKQLVNNKNKH